MVSSSLQLVSTPESLLAEGLCLAAVNGRGASDVVRALETSHPADGLAGAFPLRSCAPEALADRLGAELLERVMHKAWQWIGTSFPADAEFVGQLFQEVRKSLVR